MQELNKRIAYIIGKPIQNLSDMPVKIKTGEFDKEWENNIKDMWWYHKNTDIPVCAKDSFFDKRMFDLRDKLLTFAGREVCMPIADYDINEILTRGQIWYGDRVVMRTGAQSQCHRNSANLWHKNKDRYVLCTGYALTEDWMWRQHSWLVEPRKRKPQIIETTTHRILYFGFGMTPEEAQKFYEANI